MKISADTNVLVRAIVEDDAQQSAIAQEALAKADLVALSTPALCEFVWVLSRGYKKSPDVIADTIRRLINAANVVVDRSTADAGLSHLDAGGDFADGAIAYEGRRLGGSLFVSFDRKAVRILDAQSEAARLL